VLGLVAFLCCASLSDAQAQNTLRKIEIIGLQRLSPDEVIQSTGLQLGQRIDPSMIDAAADKLMKSGLFRTVSYRVRNADNESTVIFEVSENPPRAPSAGEILGLVKWYENRVLSSPELSAAFGLRTGDPADRSKIDKGLEAVRKAYASKGFIAAHISEFRTNDAVNRRTNYEFTVREGPQFRMGALTITGLGPADTQRLKTKWTLAPGAVFNDAYLDEYKQNTVRPFVAATIDRTGVRSKFDFETKPDARKQTVDVVINFK
jgi:outer membrane protein assembly factor BamA